MATAGAVSKGQLLRILGIGFGVAAVVGGMVGQGILRTPGIVAGAVGSPGLILALWLAGGAIAGLTAIAIVELGSSMPCAGGPYAFARRAFGPFAGTMVGWADWMITVSTLAFLAVVVGEYTHRLGLFGGVPVGLLAPSVIAIFWAINWTGTRIGGASQMIGSALKGIGLFVLVGLLFTGPAAASSQASADTLPVALGVGSFAIAMRAIQNTYDGWNNAVYFCEELERPERNLARAIFGGIALVTCLYCLVNAALLHVLTPAAIAGSTLPAADASAVVLGPWADRVLTLFGIISLGAITNLNLMFSSRIVYAMAKDGALPSVLQQVAVTGTPRYALTVTAIGAALLSASGTYTALIAINVAFGLVINMTMNIAVIRLRRTEPLLPRPFRTPLYPAPIIATLLINVLLLAALVYEDAFNSLIGLAAVAAVGLVYKARERAVCD